MRRNRHQATRTVWTMATRSNHQRTLHHIPFQQRGRPCHKPVTSRKATASLRTYRWIRHRCWDIIRTTRSREGHSMRCPRREACLATTRTSHSSGYSSSDGPLSARADTQHIMRGARDGHLPCERDGVVLDALRNPWSVCCWLWVLAWMAHAAAKFLTAMLASTFLSLVFIGIAGFSRRKPTYTAAARFLARRNFTTSDPHFSS